MLAVLDDDGVAGEESTDDWAKQIVKGVALAC